LARLSKDEENALSRKDAFAAALGLLNPNNNPGLTSQFSELIDNQSLLLLGFVRPAFPPVSKKELLITARAVVRISKALSEGVKRLIALGVPASLAAADVDASQNDLSIKLPKLIVHVDTIGTIASRNVARFDKIKHERTIYPMHPQGKAFDCKLAEIWLSAGHKFTTTTGGETELFYAKSYEAVTGDERETVSRALANGNEYVKSIKNQPSRGQKKTAASTRHLTAYLALARDRDNKSN
jgi:hypothetical protein